MSIASSCQVVRDHRFYFCILVIVNQYTLTMAIYLFHILKIIKLLKFEYFSKLRKNILFLINTRLSADPDLSRWDRFGPNFLRFWKFGRFYSDARGWLWLFPLYDFWVLQKYFWRWDSTLHDCSRTVLWICRQIIIIHVI